MRKKTEARRDAILEAATLEFMERGYEGASMSGIVARLGGSKQTLYSYFPSKDDLFVEVVVRDIGRHVTALKADLQDGGDVGQTLLRYGNHYLKIRLSPENVGLMRLVYGEAGRSDVSRLVHVRAKAKATEDMSAFLAGAMKDGRLRQADPDVAAIHLLALLDAELLEPVVLRVRDAPSDEETSRVVARAVGTFVAAYGPEAGRT